MKSTPYSFLIDVSELTDTARREIQVLRRSMNAAGFGSAYASAVRVALDQWARECGGASELSAPLKARTSKKGKTAPKKAAKKEKK